MVAFLQGDGIACLLGVAVQRFLRNGLRIDHEQIDGIFKRVLFNGANVIFRGKAVGFGRAASSRCRNTLWEPGCLRLPLPTS